MKLIAFDLDNTFLDYGKNITDENLNAILEAKKAGIEIVPATGRLYIGIPPALLDICRYYILINGAKVYDAEKDHVVYDASIPQDLAFEIYDRGDALGCLYDAYINDRGVMNESMFNKLEYYMPDKNYVKQMKLLRTPVPDLKDYIRRNNCNVQKAQFYFKTVEERTDEMKKLATDFPDLKSSSSLGHNIEINYRLAGKGLGLEALCSYLGISLDETVAFGDETNDIELLSYAGIGYCMSSGNDDVKKIADRITEYGCNDSGVAREIIKLIKN